MKAAVDLSFTSQSDKRLDFPPATVIALFNPQSKERNWQLKRAIKICLESRHSNTPVLIARQVGRENQSKKFFTLNNIPLKEIDMLSIIIIGNSKTTLIDEIFLTPRGYL